MNNKMKKANKALMVTVAILLSLVLLSTSFISGILASFTIKKEATAAVGFNAFGVGIDLTLSPALIAAIGGADAVEDCTTVTPSSIKIDIDDLKMAPGVLFTEGIRFNLTGSPVTNARLVLDVDIDFDSEQFKIPPQTNSNRTGNRFEEDLYVMPIGFQYNIYENGTKKTANYMKSLWSGNDASYIDIESLMFEDYLSGEFGANAELSGDTDLSLETTIDAGEAFVFSGASGEKINELKFSIGWPFEADESDLAYNGLTLDELNRMEAYICRDGTTPSISVSYTIRVEQIV